MTVYPFFIPHQGCKHRCVFCEQHRISGVVSAPAPAQVSQQLDSMLPLRGDGEVAFYGGSFTLLDASLQQQYLACVLPYIAAGRVSGIRISTRPDACGSGLVARLATLGVTTVELGCQSFSARVLKQASRGHAPQAAGESVRLLRDAGLRIGLQLMPGLPGGSFEEARYSLACALDLRPDFLRIYPTVVIAGTDLEKFWRQGEYTPLTLEEAVELCAELMWHCHMAGMPVIRLGLQSSVELDSGDAVVAGPYHPAFGQLVRSRLWCRALEAVASRTGGRQVQVAFADLSDALGHRRSNIDYLKQRFGSFEIVAEDALARQTFVLQGHTCDMMSKACYLQPLPVTVGCRHEMPPAFAGSTKYFEH